MEQTMDTLNSPNADEGPLLPTRQVCERYHVTDRTIDRWIQDEALGFPQPIMINKRRYFRERRLLDWERDRAKKNGVAA
jgi:predicted DNA-binding transcriptional regulator AlpA